MNVHMHGIQKEPMAKAALHSGCKRESHPCEDGGVVIISPFRRRTGRPKVQRWSVIWPFRCSISTAAFVPFSSHWALTQTLLPLCGRPSHTFADRAETKHCNPRVRSSIFKKGSDCTSHPCRRVRSREVNLHLLLSSVLNYFKIFFYVYLL